MESGASPVAAAAAAAAGPFERLPTGLAGLTKLLGEFWPRGRQKSPRALSPERILRESHARPSAGEGPPEIAENRLEFFSIAKTKFFPRLPPFLFASSDFYPLFSPS